MPKILIVDDEWLTRLEIEGMLSDLGYDVAGQAETGVEAVAMARELSPDLILMDVKMPGEMNGIDAAREIKRELKIPIVFISGYGDPEYIEAAKEIAPFGYVMKPFDEREVHAFVEIALSRRKLELELEESHERLEQTNLDLRKEIAARKNTEMALRESEEKYSKLFHSNPQWLHISTLEDGRYVEVNDAVKEITGYEREELIGRTSKELGIFADYEKRSKLVKVAQEQGGFRDQEETLVKKNGEHVSVLWSSATIEIMGTVYFINSVADISERKRAEEERELAFSQFRATLEATVDGIIVVGLDSKTKVFSKRFKKIWHMPDFVLDSEDANQVLDYMLDQMNEPEVFSQRVQAVFADPNSNTFDTLHLKDGRIFEVYSRPQKLEEKMIGRVWAFRDVTKPKQAIRERQKAKSRLQALSDASFEAIFFSDQGVCIDQNSAAERMFGYSHKEAIGRNGAEWIVPEDREKVVNNMLAGYEKPYEVTGLRKDGSTFPAEIQGHIFNFMGKATRVTALRDNSLQQQAREALQKSEDKYRNLFNSLYDIVYQLDSESKITLISPSIERISGYSPDEVLGTEVGEFYVDPERRKRLLELLVTDGHVENFEAQIRCKDNSTKWISANAKLLQDGKGNFLGVEGILRDVTDPKLAEQALRESEERFRLAFNTSPDAVNLNRLETGLYVDINEGFTQLTGYTREDVIGKTSMEINIWHDLLDRQKLIEDLQVKGHCKNLEAQFRKKNGSLITALMSAKIISLKGAPHIMSITRDISDMKAVQEAKQELEAQLQQAQKMEAISTLAGGVAHEFNNTLMGIMGNIELLRMDLPLDEGRHKTLDTMDAAGHRMSRLTDQLLAYAKGGKYQPKNLKLDDFVIETLPILEHDLNPTIRVETDFQKDISFISADNAQMQMVLSAILSNSNEAIKDEGTIRITVENKDLDENFTKQHPGLKPGYYVCLTVEDNGRGMDEETKRGIFEPFFTTKFQGRGMGMAAVYGVVMNHDGGISVDSELGKGTTVQIYLPAIEIEVAKPKKAETTVATGTGTILMIEDEDVVIEVTQAMLEMLGYRVMVAKTGKDAIHIAETFDGQIDLALLDIKLPDTNGRNLYPLIMEVRSNLKVIVSSGYSIDGPAREILDAGAQDFIQKPFSIAALSEKLKAVLEGE